MDEFYCWLYGHDFPRFHAMSETTVRCRNCTAERDVLHGLREAFEASDWSFTERADDSRGLWAVSPEAKP